MLLELAGSLNDSERHLDVKIHPTRSLSSRAGGDDGDDGGDEGWTDGCPAPSRPSAAPSSSSHVEGESWS